MKKNSDFWQIFFIREKIIRAIRDFFYKKKFHEVETPLLVPSVIPESYLDVFETCLKDRLGNKRRMFLTTSPEASIKKLLAAGIGNCFEITKSFRNGETGSDTHNPEFTILEWYRVNANYKDIMKDCEELIFYIHKRIRNNITYKNKKIDITPPWERISIVDALEKYADINFNEITKNSKNSPMFPVDKIAKTARKKGYSVTDNNSWEEIFNQIFLNEIEPHLGNHGKPTIIYDYPKPMAGLAKTKEDDPHLVERFEFYIAGLELGDCYSELTDYKEQADRFKREMQMIKKRKKTAVVADKDFLEALKIGLPQCSGIAVGIDRLVMLFADAPSIKDTLLFPLS